MAKIQKVTTKDGTIMHLLDGKLHNWEGPALIPLGNIKKGEYHINGIKLSKKEWESRKKEQEGLPFYKTSVGKSSGARV